MRTSTKYDETMRRGTESPVTVGGDGVRRAVLDTAADGRQGIVVRNVCHAFLGTAGAIPVVDDVSLEVAPGEFISIVGPSGCGKTTLLNVLSGMEPLQDGHATVLGRLPRAGDKEVGYLFARDSLLPWRTALANVTLGLTTNGMDRREARERGIAALDSVGLGHFADRHPAELSQGMRQRVALARALVLEPDVLLIDEAFGALDAHTRLHCQDVFLRVWERLSMSVVMITHDLGEAISMSDRVAIMSPRPARIDSQHEIGLPRPRRLVDLQADQDYHKLYSKIWESLREEFVRAGQA